MIITIPLGKANPIRSLTTRNNDLLHPQFTSRLNDVIRAQHIALEALIIWHQHIPCVRCEMYDCIDGTNGNGVSMARVLIVGDVEVRGQGIEDLTGVCEVRLEGVDRRMGKGGQVEVEHGVAAREEVGNHVAACFA